MNECRSVGTTGDMIVNILRSFRFAASSLPVRALLVAQMVRNLPAVQETCVRSLGWEDPLEKVNGSPLQYSSLENFMGRGAWWATIHGIAKSQT